MKGETDRKQMFTYYSVLFSETGSYYVVQAGLETLDPSAPALQVLGDYGHAPPHPPT
jgi:hypothetical protein